MPLFEYHCKECDTGFEKLVFNDTNDIRCPECDSENVSKKFSSFSAHTATGSSASIPLPGACPSGGDCPSGGGCPMAG